MNVRMPDGTVIENVPEGTTQTELQTRLDKMRAAPAPAKATVNPTQPYMDPMHQAAQEATGEASGQLGNLKPDFINHPIDAISTISSGMNIPYRAVGNAVMDATGSPVAATAAYVGSQVIGPAWAVALAKRAVRLGKIAAEQAQPFTELLTKRLAKEHKTGWKPSATITDEQIEPVLRELQKNHAPSTPVKSAEQIAKTKTKEHLTPEEITGDPMAGDLSHMDASREPQLAAPGETAMPETAGEPHLDTSPELPDPRPEPTPTGTKPVRPMRKGKTINYNEDSLLSAIKKLGGLNSGHALDITGEKGFRASVGNVGLWKKGGVELDGMVTLLAEHGYIPPEALRDVDGGVQWLRDAIRAEFDGHKIYSARGSEDVIFGRMRDEQGGKIDPALVTRIASTSTGAVIGAGMDPDNPVHGAILGAAGGFTMGHIVSRRVINGGFGSALKVADNPGKILHDAKEAEIAAGQRNASQVFEQLRAAKLAPDRGFAVIRAVETGDVSGLLPQEIQVAQMFAQEVGRLGTAAQEAGLIPNLRKNYAPLLFDWSDAHTAKTLRKLGAEDPAKGDRTSGFSTFTPFKLERTIDDYAMAIKLGLKPKTTDPAELYRLYASSVIRATENKRAVTELANLKGPDGKALVAMQGDKSIGADWVPINKGDVRVPELDGFMVHPDIADSVRAGLTSYDPNIIARSAMNVSWFAKRFNVSLSAFHPMALLQAHAGAGGNPFAALGGAAARGVEKLTGINVPYESAVDKALQAYKQGGAGDAVDMLVRNGLKIEAPLEDRSGRNAFQATAKLIADKADTLVPGGGLIPKGAAAVDTGLQHFTWDYMYTGMKLATGMKMLEQEVQRNMVAAAAGKEALRPLNEIAADVSSFVNSTYGGLNLRRIAEDVAKQWGDKAGSAAYAIASPRGQAYAQMAVFAPDWKMSTLQAWTRGLGLTGNETVQRFHREYLVRSAFMSMVLADAVNVKMSGHHVWQNDFHTKRGHKQTALEAVHDATYVDLGDGRKMQMFKHFMEGPHAVSDPQKFALNALGYIPRVAGTMATNKQFLTPDWAPPIAENSQGAVERAYRYAMWPLQEATPIAAMNFDAGLGPSVGSFVGTPIYGASPEQKQKRAQQRMEEKSRALGNK